MRYKIDKQSDHFRADCLDMPGTPPCGIGKTEVEAVIHLFERLLSEKAGPESKWLFSRPLDFSKIEVNGVEWDWPDSYKRNGR